jgi:hypothetical protein
MGAGRPGTGETGMTIVTGPAGTVATANQARVRTSRTRRAATRGREAAPRRPPGPGCRIPAPPTTAHQVPAAPARRDPPSDRPADGRNGVAAATAVPMSAVLMSAVLARPAMIPASSAGPILASADRTAIRAPGTVAMTGMVTTPMDPGAGAAGAVRAVTARVTSGRTALPPLTGTPAPAVSRAPATVRGAIPRSGRPAARAATPAPVPPAGPNRRQPPARGCLGTGAAKTAPNGPPRSGTSSPTSTTGTNWPRTSR